MNSSDASKFLVMNNKAVKDAIKRGCRLFPEFDMQGFRLVCKICNIPMDINDNTRLIDLEAHTKSEKHLSNMGSDKTRMTRAKAHRDQLGHRDQSSPNQNVDKSSAKNGSSPLTPSPSTSRKSFGSTPPTASRGKGKAGRPRKVHSLTSDNSIKPVISDLIASDTSSSSTFSSSSSYTTVSSITPITTRVLNTIKKKNLTRDSPKIRDKIIVLSDDTQESVYLSGPDDISDNKSTGAVNKDSSSKINTKENAKNSRDGVNPNQMKSSTSISDIMVTPKSELTEVPTTSTSGSIAQAVSVVDNQVSESQNDQTLTVDNNSPKFSVNLDNDRTVVSKDDPKANFSVDPIVTSSDANRDVTCDELNTQESTLNNDPGLMNKPGDSLLVPPTFVPPAIPIALPLALAHPSTDPDSNQNDSGNFNETEDVDKTSATPNEVSNQTTSTPESGATEQLTKTGAKKQRKRKQSSTVKEEPVTPSKTTRTNFRRNSSDHSDLGIDGDSMTKSKSGRKTIRKRKIMRISDFALPSATDTDTVSPIAASDDNVNPLRRIASSEKPDCSESASPSTSNILNSSNLSIPSPLRATLPLPTRKFTLPPTSISMATNEVTTTNSNSLDGGELDQRSATDFNSTYSINTTDDNIDNTLNTSTYNSLNEANSKIIKKEAEVQCEFMNVSQHSQSVKPEPSGPNDEYQAGRQEFYHDLIKFCLDSNISFKKLTGSDSRSFFHKNFGVSIPRADEMKSRVLQPLQQSKMEKLKGIVANHNIYLIMKIHNNDDKGHILTILVGILNGQPDRTYLYKLSVIQKVDLTVLSRELLNALHNLFQGLVFEKLSLLITDDSPLMGQIASFLKTLHPKVRHITCFYQVCDDICEQFRQSHPHMKLYVNTVNGFLFSSPKILSKFKLLSSKYRELPIPASKLHGFNWMLVAGDFFEEHNKITTAIDESLEGPTKENYLAKINCLLENKDLQSEWIDFNGYSCLEMAIDLMKSQTMSITQMKEMIEGLGRNPKRSVLIQRIKDLIRSSPSLEEMLAIAGRIATDEETDLNLKLLNYAPLSTLASFNCYETFLAILKENGGSLEDSLLETLTFLAHNKDL